MRYTCPRYEIEGCRCPGSSRGRPTRWRWPTSRPGWRSVTRRATCPRCCAGPGTPLATREVAEVCRTQRLRGAPGARPRRGRGPRRRRRLLDPHGLTPWMRSETRLAARRTWVASSARSLVRSGNVSATAATGWRGVVEHRARDRGEPGRDEPVLLGVAVARARVARSARSCVSDVGPASWRRVERAAVREQRGQLLRRERGEHRQPARGQVRGEPDADVGDQRRPVRRALLDHVEDVAAVQHREVRVVGGRR